MTMQPGFSLKVVATLGTVTLCLLILGLQGHADTLAYWRFGDDGTTPADGDWITTTAGRTTVEADPDLENPPAYILGYDSTGNGNSLYTWNDDGSGHQYREFVSNRSALKSGAPNDFSVQNNGGFPSTFTWSVQSSPTVDVGQITPSAWTIEASIYKTENAFHQTFVGREGNGVAADANLAPLYFKTIDGNLQILFTDVAGNSWDATDPDDIALNSWYNVAAVSDGSTLSLYKDSGRGYEMVASTNISSSANSALAYDTDGSTTENDPDWGWTIGRGRYGGSDSQFDDHVDRWLGYVDEVRISDSALNPSEFLWEPAYSLVAEVTASGASAGNVTLKNVSDDPVILNYYLVESAGGALDTDGWNSLSEQGLGAGRPEDVDGSGTVGAGDISAWQAAYATNADGDTDSDGDSDGADFLNIQRAYGLSGGAGFSFDVAGGSSSTSLAELNIGGALTIAPGASVDLGQMFDTSVFGTGVDGDLGFSYGTPGSGALAFADVQYVSSLNASAAVPEPTTLLGLASACAAVFLRRSTKN